MLLVIGYVAYLYYDYRTWNGYGIRDFAARHQQFIAGNHTIDSLVLGGSNSVLSISAEILNSKTNKNWYNASMISEAYSDQNYQAFIISSFDKSKRERIETVLFSSLVPFLIGEIKLRANYSGPIEGHHKVGLKPGKSIVSKLKSFIVDPERTAFPPQILQNKFGDFEFEGFACNAPAYQDSIYHREDIALAASRMSALVLAYTEIFPNAKLYLVFPSAYYAHANEQSASEFNRMLTAAISRSVANMAPKLLTRLHFVEQPMYPGSAYMCNTAHYANLLGRQWRTEDLANRIQALMALDSAQQAPLPLSTAATPL